MPDPDERDVMSIPPGVPVLITLRDHARREPDRAGNQHLRSNW
ncbi:hypothetical protein Ae717Ps2_6908c [Pseudonocardia sp. Ae717_Ps2]|nr:hypothetical protein Ae717Ps2_6908c [Pseudonocardia sp. Ae717_Ps2]